MKNIFQSMRWMLKSYEYRVRFNYDVVAPRNYFAENTLYMNMGYWKDSLETLDEACQAMIELLGEKGQFAPGDHILDVGFGFGDQDIFWAKHFAPERIVGINISHYQVKNASKRIIDYGLAEQIQLQMGSGTSIPFQDAIFDKVISVESAFHFATRQDFFRESYRVLRPGGRLIVTDILPLPGQKLRHFTIKQNMYSRSVYAEKLAESGFINVNVTSYREQVCVPFMQFLSRRLHEPDIVQRISPAIRRSLRSTTSSKDPCAGMDYVLAFADKPAA